MKKVRVKTLIDIKEVAKNMTREEFVKEMPRGVNGKVNTKYNCPELYNLKSYDSTILCLINGSDSCEDCWRNAVKDIKFKDDMEVEKVSKKLNIIEAMKMPIGTEFKVTFYNDETFDCHAKIIESKNVQSKKQLVWHNRANSEIGVTDSSTTATFIPIQQPVSFMEAIKAYHTGENIYCKHGISTYSYVTGAILIDNKGRAISTVEILDGKWYIEESEELEDERLS